MKSRLYNRRILFLLVFAVYMLTAFFIYPIAQATGQDEFTTIGWSALFAGRDWSDVLSYRKYYGFGYTFLYTPLFWITDSPIVIYRCMLIGNAVVNGVSSVLAYSTIQILQEDDNKEFSFWMAVGMSFIPLKFVNVVNETIIICVIWSIMYVLGRTFEEPHKKTRNTFMILSVLLYSITIHTRLLLLIALVVFVIVFISIFKKIKIINYSVFFFLLCIGYIILNKLGDKIVAIYGIGSNLETDTFSNTAVGLQEVLAYKINRIFSMNSVKSIFITFFGQIETGNIIMGGVFLVSLVVGGIYIFRFLIKKEENLCLFAVIMIALGGILLTIIGQGIMVLADFKLYANEEINGLLLARRSNLYLRYYNIYVGPLIACAFIFLKHYITKINYRIIPWLLVTSIMAKIYMILFGDKYMDFSIYNSSPTYNVFSLGGVLTGEGQITTSVISATIVCSLFVFVIIGISAKRNISYSVAFLSFFFMILYIINVIKVYNQNSIDVYNQNIGFYNTLKCVSESGEIPETIYLPEGDKEEYRLQFFLNRYNLKYSKPKLNQEAIMIYRKKENIKDNNVDVYKIDNCGYIVVQGSETKQLFTNAICDTNIN